MPNNAILVVAGNLKKSGDTEGVLKKIERWFGTIPSEKIPTRNLPQEPHQKEQIRRVVKANVPLEALYMGFRSPARLDKEYYAVDLLTDVLSNGSSSRFYQKLVKEKRLFSEIDCFQTGNIDPGLIIIEGKPTEGVSIEVAEAAVWAELELVKNELIAENELQKLKNKIESQQAFGDAGALNKAMNLAYYELLGDAQVINTEFEMYKSVSTHDIQRVAQSIFTEKNSSILIYQPQNNK